MKELATHNILDLIHPDDREAQAASIQTVETGEDHDDDRKAGNSSGWAAMGVGSCGHADPLEGTSCVVK